MDNNPNNQNPYPPNPGASQGIYSGPDPEPTSGTNPGTYPGNGPATGYGYQAGYGGQPGQANYGQPSYNQAGYSQPYPNNPYANSSYSGPTSVQQAYQLNELLSSAPAPQPTKNKKTPLFIAGGVIALLAVILVVVSMMPSSSEAEDPVSVAVSRFLAGAAPEYAQINGKADFITSSSTSFAQPPKLQLKTDLATQTLANSTVATLGFTPNNKGAVSLKLSEIYSSGDNLYVKLDGISLSLDNQKTTDTYSSYYRENEDASSTSVSQEYLDCLSSVEETDCSSLLEAESSSIFGGIDLTTILEPLTSIDGQWILLSAGQVASSASGTVSSSSTNELTQCAVDLVGDLHNRRDAMAELYTASPFIYSAFTESSGEEYEKLSDPDRRIISALSQVSQGLNDPYDSGYDDYDDYSDEEEEGEEVVQPAIYQVVFDEEALAGFIEAALASGNKPSSLSSCLGQTSDSLDIEKATGILSQLPNIYVMLNANGDFERIYFAVSLDSKNSIAFRFNLSYPETITISDPTNFKTLPSGS